jgi:hypothetical protein
LSSDRLVNGQWPTDWVEANELLAGIDAREASQQQLAESLGHGYEALKGARKGEQAMLTLLWKAKTDLYAQAIEVQAERHPLRNATAGNILGTKMKERILAAIKRRKGPVEKVIKLFNKRRHDFLKKYDPARLLNPENQDLTYAAFLEMDLDDPLWNDSHFYSARAPWSIDPNVRRGITSVLMLDRVEEEVEMITQELDRAMTWACQYHGKIEAAINCLGMCLVYSTFGSLLIFRWALDLTAADPNLDSNNEYSEILPKFPVKGKLQLLKSELTGHLDGHERLMLRWSAEVAVLWRKTRSQHTGSNHPWFEHIERIRSRVLPSGELADLDDAIEQLGFQENDVEVEQDEEWETLDNDHLEDVDGDPQDCPQEAVSPS